MFIELTSSAVEDGILIPVSMTCTEMMSGPFKLDVDLVATSDHAASVTAATLLGTKATIRLRLTDDHENGPSRYFNGVVTAFSRMGDDVSSLDPDRNFIHFRAEIRPWTWLMNYRSDCRIFQQESVPAVVLAVFEAMRDDFASLVSFEPQTRLSHYPVADYCVQYNETDFNFVSRLLEEQGIGYYFTHEEDSHRLRFADGPAPLPVCQDELVLHYPPLRSEVDERRCEVTSWHTSQTMHPGRYSLDDHHFQIPNTDLATSAPTNATVGNNESLQLYEYPGGQSEPFNEADRARHVLDEGRRLVEVRMETEECWRFTREGDSNCRALKAGHTFKLEHAHDESQSGMYALTAVTHYARQSPTGRANDGDFAYENRFECIPEESPFRPRRQSRKPVIAGIQTAEVVGPDGDEIYTDEFGRVKVQFHWDRQGQRNHQSSCWVRVAQAWAGQGWGVHFWPRVGHEVVVAFLDGDPDRPLITGSVYNGINKPPYDLPMHQTQSGIKTRSTPNGNDSNFNELRFEDRTGQEQIYLHAERSLDVAVEANETRNVGANRTTHVREKESLDVKERETYVEETDHLQAKKLRLNVRERFVTVHEDDSLIVFGDQSEEYQAGRHIHVIKDEFKGVDGVATIEAGQAIELKVGDNSIRVDRTGVTIQGMMVRVQSELITSIDGGPLTQVKGRLTGIEGSTLVAVN